MADNKGKKFEKQFEKDWGTSFPNSFLLRLKDDTSGYYGSSRNPCDYIAYVSGKLFLIEVKTHLGNTFPFSSLRQYDDLKQYAPLKGVYPGVVLWMQDHDKVMYFPVDTITNMMKDECKSINVRKLDGYRYLDLPSTKKRVFMNTDYRDIIDFIEEDK